MLALLLAAALDPTAPATLTEILTTSIASDARLEVVSSADLRRQIELEANKQALGCDASSSSCLAEIAGAMGAQDIVYGKLGVLDDVIVLTLSVFDAQGKAVGRVALRESSLGKLSEKIDDAARQLTAPLAPATKGARPKVLVLDIEPPGARSAAPARSTPRPPDPPRSDGPQPSGPPASPSFWGGIGGVGGGALVAGIGVALFLAAGEVNASAKGAPDAIKANDDYNLRDALGASSFGAMGLGVAGLVAGVALLATSGS